MAVKLAQRRWGEGPAPVVFLHGFTGCAAAFDHLEPLLGRAVSAIALDLPGHGASPVAPNGGSGWDATIDAILDALDRAQSGPAHLVGYSMGGRLALAVALRAPEKLRSIVIESGSPGLRDDAERAARRASDEELAQSIERDGIAAFIARWEQSEVLASLQRLPQDARDALRARRLEQKPAGLAWALRSLGLGAQPNLWPQLRAVSTRSLLVHGARDDKFRATSERMALRIPDASLREIRGAGHAPHLERPHLYAAALLDFWQARAGESDISITEKQERAP
jgi:2-succinyl-6-hydroxy-2,4-cyclohexadiene-1-carboxylate synthase